jgi:hypothetical protein
MNKALVIVCVVVVLGVGQVEKVALATNIDTVPLDEFVRIAYHPDHTGGIQEFVESEIMVKASQSQFDQYGGDMRAVSDSGEGYISDGAGVIYWGYEDQHVGGYDYQDVVVKQTLTSGWRFKLLITSETSGKPCIWDKKNNVALAHYNEINRWYAVPRYSPTSKTVYVDIPGAAVGDLSWDPSNDGLGGIGNWNTTDLNWDNTPPLDIDSNVAWTGGENAGFKTGSGVVTINEGGAIEVNTITFNSPDGAYTIDAISAGDSLNLTSGTIIADTDATINAKVTAYDLSKLGTGSLTLNDISSLTGTINATAGTLTVGDPAGLLGGVTGVTFGADSTLVNSSGGLMDWTAKAVTVNGDFRLGAGDGMKFDDIDIDPGTSARFIIIDNAIEVSRFTGNYGVIFDGAGTMILTGDNSDFQWLEIRDNLTVALNGIGTNMLGGGFGVHDNATIRLDADDQLANGFTMYDSSTMDINSRTATVGSVYLRSSDASIQLTTGNLTVAGLTFYSGATIDTGTSGTLTVTGGISTSNYDSGTITIGGSGTLNHDGDFSCSVPNGPSDIDLRVDARITGDGATASGVLSFQSDGTALLTNPNNDFNLRVDGSSKLLLGTAGAQGTGEIEMASGYLGAVTGTNITVNNNIKLTGYSGYSVGFTGDGDLTVAGRINTGAADRFIHFDNTGLVTLAGQIANFDDATIQTQSFRGSGSVVLTDPVNDYSLKVEGATVLFSATGGGGTREIEMHQGRLGAPTGAISTLSNDIKLTGYSSGFAGAGDLTVTGRINTGASNRTLELDNNGLVTVSGGIGNFDTVDIQRLTFRGAGDLAVATPGNPIHNASIWWHSSGTLTFTGPQQLAGDLRVYNGSVELTGDQTVAGDFITGNNVSVTISGAQQVGGDLFVSGSSLTINGTQQVGGSVSISTGVSAINGGTLISGGRITVESTGQAVLNGTQVTAPTIQIDPGASLSGHGTVTGKISTSAGSTITADGGTLTLGDAGQFAAFSHQGELHVGAAAVLLQTQGFASLGPLTTLAGGTLSADNGIVIGPGSSVLGSGIVDAKISSGFGSTIQASGDLALGDANSYDGFYSDGTLVTGAYTVTINDLNQAVLGSLTHLGADGEGGSLVADNGLLVEFGKNVVGRGTIDTPDDELIPLMNNGAIIGDSPGAIELTGYVKGVGTLENVMVSGTLSPGFSPVRLHATNLEIAATGELLMELGGLSGGSECDQLDVTGELHLGGTLRVSLIGGFSPDIGNTFDILDWDTLVGSEFDVLELPELTGRNTWDTSSLYSTGEISVIAMLDGDTDGDRDVDGADYAAFVGVFGGAGDRYTDFNEDGRVDLMDFVILRENFGTGVPSGLGAESMATTPEPATLLLMAFGGLAVLRRRR